MKAIKNPRTPGGQNVRRPLSTKFKTITTLRVEVLDRPSATPKLTHFTMMNMELLQAHNYK
jgi:hypothetical protein